MRDIERSTEALIGDVEAMEEELANERTTFQIERRLGSITVDGNGRLVALSLDADRVKMSDRRVLGARIIQALDMARAEMQKTYKHRLNEIGRRA